MLKQRVITASVLALVFLGSLFYLPWSAFALIIGAVLCVGAWEWANLSGVQNWLARILYVAAVTCLALVAFWYTNWVDNVDYLRWVLVAASVWWAISLLWIQGYPSSALLWGSRPVRLIMGAFVLIPPWLSCLYLRAENAGALLVLMVVLIVAAADIGAYFSGKAIGKRKLAAAVSPGKSWEGAVGGACFAMIIAVAFNFIVDGRSWLALFMIVIPTALVSVVGDLLESMVKRHRGVKDSSRLLPGHGGVLDRIDGLVAAIPVFALLFMSCNWRI